MSHSFLVGSAIIFLIIGVGVLISYGVNLNYNEDFTQGSCYTASGLVLPGQCKVGGYNCENCYQACWAAFFGITVIPKAVEYFFLGNYFDEKSANDAINYQVGQFYGICYYKDGGYTIIFQLADVHDCLIAGIVFVGLFGLIVVGYIIFGVLLKFYAKTEREKDPLVAVNAEHSMN